MTYKEQLRDRRWQTKRTKILSRDKNECQNSNCKFRNDHSVLVEVHHLYYLENTLAWDYPDDMLLSLCSRCHQNEQDRPKEERYLMNTLRMKGFLISDLLAHSVLIETDQKFTDNLLKILREFQNR
jgi:5-methylcytosine-specific restriction endonuclease McrA